MVDSVDSTFGPRVKLADFGFAKELTKGQKESLVVGTRLYMAPELVKKELYDEKIDVWALGVLAFYLWTYGDYPFPGISKEVVDNKIQYQPPEMDRLDRVHCPEDAKKFIEKCLNKDKDQRPSAQELLVGD